MERSSALGTEAPAMGFAPDGFAASVRGGGTERISSAGRADGEALEAAGGLLPDNLITDGFLCGPERNAEFLLRVTVVGPDVAANDPGGARIDGKPEWQDALEGTRGQSGCIRDSGGNGYPRPADRRFRTHIAK